MNLRRLFRLTGLAWVLALAGLGRLACAAQTTEVYETYLPAQKLVPVIEPLLSTDDRITAYHNKLFIKANPETQRDVLTLLERVDRLPMNILVSLRFSDDEDADQLMQSWSADHAKETAATEPVQSQQIKVFRGSSTSTEIEVEMVPKRRFSTRLDKADQKIRVLEGEQGVLTLSKESPQTRWVLLNPFGAQVSQEYRSVGSQMYVIPYLLKDGRVRLEVFSQNQQFRGDSESKTKKMEAQSVLLLEPGVWTLMAGSEQLFQGSSDGFQHSTHSDNSGNKAIQIKVDVLE